MGATKTYKIMHHDVETDVVEEMIVSRKSVMARFESLMSMLAEKGLKVVGSGDVRYVYDASRRRVDLYYVAHQFD